MTQDKRIEAVGRAICRHRLQVNAWYAHAIHGERFGDILEKGVEIGWSDYLGEAQAAITAYEKALEEDGYVRVPREPLNDLHKMLAAQKPIVVSGRGGDFDDHAEAIVKDFMECALAKLSASLNEKEPE